MPAVTEQHLDANDRLSATFAALANPVRRAMLVRLAAGEASVSELAEPFDISMPAVSRHVKVLEKAGLVVQGQRAQYRPCRIDASPLREVVTWAEYYRPIWEDRLDRLADYLDDIQSDTTPATRNRESPTPKRKKTS